MDFSLIHRTEEQCQADAEWIAHVCNTHRDMERGVQMLENTIKRAIIDIENLKDDVWACKTGSVIEGLDEIAKDLRGEVQ